MGITGLALCGFLVVHLSGNFLLYVGAEQYDAYAHALHSQKILLPIAETGLFILLILHIALGIITARENWAARAVRYDMQRSKVVETTSKGAPNFASKYMFVTGLVSPWWSTEAPISVIPSLQQQPWRRLMRSQ